MAVLRAMYWLSRQKQPVTVLFLKIHRLARGTLCRESEKSHLCDAALKKD